MATLMIISFGGNMITLKALIIANSMAIAIDLVALTILLVMNIKEMRCINGYLRNEQEEKEIEDAMREYNENIEIL